MSPSVLVVHSPEQSRHRPTVEVEFGVPVPPYEIPGRVDSILAVLRDRPEFIFAEPVPAPRRAVTAVHDAALVDFLESQTLGISRPGATLGIPDTFLLPAMRDGMVDRAPPAEPASQLGFWCFDTMTPLSAGSYRAARAAVDVAVTATRAVLDGERAAYALCRPPGHHAAAAMYGGYCYLNNVAVAASTALEEAGRVAILDVDYHHGNGTQQIFYGRGEVLYVSLHGHPDRAFPYYTGFDDETGAGEGRGTTLNLPLPAGCSDEAYLAALDRALERIAAYSPDILFVSLGTDTIQGDPLGDLCVSREAFPTVGARTAQLGAPMVVVQEGGYRISTVGEDVCHWLLAACPPGAGHVSTDR